MEGRLSMTDNKPSSLVERYSYKTRYISDASAFIEKVIAKTILPHQLEIQPGRILGESLCWLKCPYCYGGSAKNSHERLKPERLLDVLRESAQGPHGGVPKVVFAGYATDPLNYEHIDDLLEQAIVNGQITGFHTKALKLSDRFVALVTSPKIRPLSYFSVSVDAGSAQTYNFVHGVGSKADIYSKVLGNIRRISIARKQTGAKLDISATYLITRKNNSVAEIAKAIENLASAGVDLIRFSFPQVPRGQDAEKAEQNGLFSRGEIAALYKELSPIVKQYDSPSTKVMILDYEEQFGIKDARSFPCFARFVFPSIGYDGYLSHCSESSAPHFRDMVLGNLEERGFWDLYYDYDAANLLESLERIHKKMEKNDCRCDRKEHVVNAIMREHFKGKR
jgi:MoaA/NifB/PqqE/SkfB family radical SAM enzyme